MNGWLVVAAMIAASLGSLAIVGLGCALVYRWAVRRGTYR